MLVDCLNCRAPLVLPPGAKSIRCSVCQFITTQPPSPSDYSVFPGLQQSSSFDKQLSPVPSGYQVRTPTLTHSSSFYSNYVPPTGYGRKKAVIVGASYQNARLELKGSINDANYMKHLLLTNLQFPELEIVNLAAMKNLHTDSTSEQLAVSFPVLQSQFVITNSELYHPSESNNNDISISMDDNSGYESTTPTASRGRRDNDPINGDDRDQFPPPFAPGSLRLPDLEGLPHYVYSGVIVIMYPSLTQMVQLKFQNKQSPFETHVFLTHMAVVAYSIAIPSLVLSLYVRGHLESTVKKRFHVFLKNVFVISGIVAPLALVNVLLIPHRFNWIGYPIIIAPLVIKVVCSFGGYIKSYFLINGYAILEHLKVTINKLFSRKTCQTWKQFKEMRDHRIPY